MGKHRLLLRARVGRKNDNAFIEEKNWSTIRRSVGYARYDTPKQVAQLNAFYDVQRVYFNHFIPVRKLIKTERRGQRVTKIYDAPKTPYQRVLESSTVSEQVKAQLRREHAKLDVVVLKQEWNRRLAAVKPTSLW